MFKYLAGFVATIVLIILLIVLVFHGGGGSKVSQTSKPLTSYANSDATVSLTIAGPVVANQNYNQVGITVSNSQTVYDQVQGYQNNVTKQQTFSNNVPAYTAFLYALERAGFTEGNSASNLKQDLGYCPTGNTYIFQINQGSQQLQRYWITNCSGTPASFKGASNLIIELFKAQVPNYNQLTPNLNF
jgi:hypothetical protein